jgi:hypothetical protein
VDVGVSDELLSGFGRRERALLLNVIKREDEARTEAEQRRPRYRKPTDAELIAAGWKSPPPPPPTEAELLSELGDVLREEGPRSWTLFSWDADEVLRKLHEREPGLLRHKVTKCWGDMWRLAATTPAG